jgi:flagellar basal-body rod modification protein FlgD
MSTTLTNATATPTSTAANNAASSALLGNKTQTNDPAAMQDRFLKLLVAQMNNQDPMNPMDNAQLTSQMAQINTVSGIQELNQAVSNISSQFGAMQMLQGSGLIGRDVMYAGNQLNVQNGVAKGAVDLAASVEDLKIQITNDTGQVIDTVALGAQAAGRANFSWDASSYKGSGNVYMKVTATAGGKAMDTTGYVAGTVKSVSADNKGGLSLLLQNGKQLNYSGVQSIL